MILAITVIIVLEPSQRKDLYVLAMLVVDTLRGGGGYFKAVLGRRPLKYPPLPLQVSFFGPSLVSLKVFETSVTQMTNNPPHYYAKCEI